jgi:hypothetical protein
MTIGKFLKYLQPCDKHLEVVVEDESNQYHSIRFMVVRGQRFVIHIENNEKLEGQKPC